MAQKQRSLLINASGACATAATLIIIVVFKFNEGAWITVIVIPPLIGCSCASAAIVNNSAAKPMSLGRSI